MRGLLRKLFIICIVLLIVAFVFWTAVPFSLISDDANIVTIAVFDQGGTIKELSSAQTETIVALFKEIKAYHYYLGGPEITGDFIVSVIYERNERPYHITVNVMKGESRVSINKDRTNAVIRGTSGLYEQLESIL